MTQVQYIRTADYAAAAKALGVAVEVVKTVAAVEARQSGFIGDTDLPWILFEGHHFHRRTGGQYSRDYPQISYPRWTKAHYRGGRGEYDRLMEAIEVHSGSVEPALLSTSWGMFQIMGFNFDKCGYASVEDFVNDMGTGEPAHLRAFVAFIRACGLADELQGQDWEDFARQYNGPGYKRNAYHTKLAAEFAKACAAAQEIRTGGEISFERGDAVALQSALNVALGDLLPTKLVPDGWIGPKTKRAIRLFQRQNGLSETGLVDSALCAELGLEFEHADLLMAGAELEEV